MSAPHLAPRYARQRRLFEVGVRGQLAICAAAVRVPGSGLASEQCALYLAAAGVARVTADNAELTPALHALRTDFAHIESASAARESVCVDPAATQAGAPGERTEHVPSDPRAAEAYRGALAALAHLRALIGV